jgi:hypothetical protein
MVKCDCCSTMYNDDDECPECRKWWDANHNCPICKGKFEIIDAAECELKWTQIALVKGNCEDRYEIDVQHEICNGCRDEFILPIFEKASNLKQLDSAKVDAMDFDNQLIRIENLRMKKEIKTITQANLDYWKVGQLEEDKKQLLGTIERLTPLKLFKIEANEENLDIHEMIIRAKDEKEAWILFEKEVSEFCEYSEGLQFDIKEGKYDIEEIPHLQSGVLMFSVPI